MQWKVLYDGQLGGGAGSGFNGGSTTDQVMGLLGGLANAWSNHYLAKNDKREAYKELGQERAHTADKVNNLYEGLVPNKDGKLDAAVLDDLNYRRRAIDPSAGLITNDNWQLMRNKDAFNAEYSKGYTDYLDGQKRINAKGVLAPSAYYDNRTNQYTAGINEVGGLMPQLPAPKMTTQPAGAAGLIQALNSIYG